MKVFPEPVAIWMRARGRSASKELSRFAIACSCDRQSPRVSRAGIARRRCRSVGRSGEASALATQRASVSGRWNENTRCERGSGSSRFVNRVSTPVESYANGSRSKLLGISSGRPVVYFADCSSTPVSVVPADLASTLPAA